ncbi:MAG: MobC family plasmid mobilization relaxosome protein [Candidatus Eremiobacteraeota bacterium]|nr:MobC family plasmid mobilization relaxosome protein [Candidatus Eremiobacteraeota bacterium]
MTRGAARNIVLKVRLSESERARLAAVAAAAGKTVAELVRSDAGRLTVRDTATERARVAMLNRINANLNMIARWVNTHRSAADAVQVIAELATVERAISALAQRHDE